MRLRRPRSRQIREHPIGSPAHQARVDELVAAPRRHRSQPGGYWVAGAKPAAAYEAVAGSLPRSLITRAALLSDGVSCLVERYGAGDWSRLLTVLSPDPARRTRSPPDRPEPSTARPPGPRRRASHRAPSGARPAPPDGPRTWWRDRGARGTSPFRGPGRRRRRRRRRQD